MHVAGVARAPSPARSIVNVKGRETPASGSLANIKPEHSAVQNYS
jgi:hypothetical protein